MNLFDRKFLYIGIMAAISAKALAVDLSAWSTSTTPSNADKKNAYGENLSGLFYTPVTSSKSAHLWAVKNSPSVLYRLKWSNKNYIASTSNGWSNGKILKYTDNNGAPDSEGITFADTGVSTIYVASERNGDTSSGTNLNDAKGNRFSVLSYDVSGSSTSIRASREWNVTAAMPANTPVNKGPEAIAWVPDTYLVNSGFYDESARGTYRTSTYSKKQTAGVFFLGMEETGNIYAFVLNTDSTFTLIATIDSGEGAIMDLSFDRDNNVLWAHCDNGCGNRDHLLAIDTVSTSATKGRFVIKKAYNPPSALPMYNFEGIAIAPESECVNAEKHFMWADDSDDGGHAIWQGTVKCGALY